MHLFYPKHFFFNPGKTIYLRKHTNLDDTVLQKIAKRKPSSLSLVQCNGKNVTLDGLRNLFKYCSESLEVCFVISHFHSRVMGYYCIDSCEETYFSFYHLII